MLMLREIEGELREFASSFDPARYDARAIEALVGCASRIEKMAATIKGRAAARLAETNAHLASGEKSPAHHLAKLAGTSVGQAAESINTARRLEEMPEVADAAARGELSAQQTSLITDALANNGSADPRRLIAKAQSSSVAELRGECERIKAAGDDDAEARRKRIHDDRQLRRSRHGDGSESVTWRDNPERIAQLYASISPARDRLFAQARKAGRRERSEALDADALHETLCSKTSSRGRGTTSKILVRVDFDTLLRGYTIHGEVCEIAGYGPIALSAVRDLVATGNSFLAAIVTKGEKVVGVAHLGRQPTALQQTALEWRDPTCAREGCPNTARLQRDHRHDWADTKVTLLDWLDRLCAHDHDLKTLHGWALVQGTGKRPMVPPDDPRHPRHRPRAGPAPPEAA